ncbi:MAG: glycosyl transferase [Betaproteobacteria bacterium HGW-Betaproteobacteria-6]|jgi:rSAM/selenodomain-associated transferase 2|nr:MAG: glycosyl transferase [Betaproteobacteria bacterium HGW-Betaproteobacteria-6]
MNTPTLSIIIPVLNEADGIVQVLERLQGFRRQGAEVIVVDGGSADGTAERARPLADCVTTAGRGRGLQMNAGAARASGDVFLFLHADTLLPASAPSLIIEAIDHGACWGRFDVRIEGAIRGLGLVAFMMNWRSRLTGIATGDQALFVTRAAFLRHGGFPAIPLMEDIVFSSWMREEARPACLTAKVTTSGRRWEKHGLLRTILTMWWLRLRFFLGASPTALAREYGYIPHET